MPSETIPPITGTFLQQQTTEVGHLLINKNNADWEAMAMVYGENAVNCGIQKRLISPGKGVLSQFPDGTKVQFHYQTRRSNEEHTVLDDSKKGPKPMELYLGKKFKLEVWEKCLKTMLLNEVASFTVDKSLVGAYPLVAKSLRDIEQGKASTGHQCCGLAMKEVGLGYADLDEMMLKPEDLEFILELEKVDEPGDYVKDTWAMDEKEKLSAVPTLKVEGNDLYKEKKYAAAADKYGEAIGILEQLMIREKPGDEEWVELDTMKIPLLLNYSQCKLFLQDYYPVIEHTSEVLKKDSDNVKALFRRAKAHVGAWNPAEAKQDFRRVAELDSSLQRTVHKEIKLVEEKERQKDSEDRSKLEGKIFG